MTKKTAKSDFDIRKAFEQEKYEEIFNRFIKNNDSTMTLDADEVLILGFVCEELNDFPNAERFYQALGESGNDLISLEQGKIQQSFVLLEKLVGNGFSLQEDVPDINTSMNMMQAILGDISSSPASNEEVSQTQKQNVFVVGFPSITLDKNGNPIRVFAPHIFLPAGFAQSAI